MKKNRSGKKKGKTDISENISKQSLDKIRYVPITTIKKKTSLYSRTSSNILPQTENNNKDPGNTDTATAEVL